MKKGIPDLSSDERASSLGSVTDLMLDRRSKAEGFGGRALSRWRKEKSEGTPAVRVSERPLPLEGFEDEVLFHADRLTVEPLANGVYAVIRWGYPHFLRFRRNLAWLDPHCPVEVRSLG
jgi:hypothetical protein